MGHTPQATPSSQHGARELLRSQPLQVSEDQPRQLTMNFTSLCPRTGQPDFGSVRIDYTPAGAGVDPGSLQDYIWSYREVGVFCEDLAAIIADDIVSAIAPKSLSVRVVQNPRGGIGITVVARRGG